MLIWPPSIGNRTKEMTGNGFLVTGMGNVLKELETWVDFLRRCRKQRETSTGNGHGKDL
jgi:hypothetical protein